mmetsp:Transcript_72491/g.224041  ORF Transcript_72491/g.224041 Transcript_72491/m.224041 type:complete len:369 (+) Transcript_72491:220-1326(+)
MRSSLFNWSLFHPTSGAWCGAKALIMCMTPVASPLKPYLGKTWPWTVRKSSFRLFWNLKPLASGNSAKISSSPRWNSGWLKPSISSSWRSRAFSRVNSSSNDGSLFTTRSLPDNVMLTQPVSGPSPQSFWNCKRSPSIRSSLTQAPVARRVGSCGDLVSWPSRTRMPPLSPPPTTSQRGRRGGVGGTFDLSAGVYGKGLLAASSALSTYGSAISRLRCFSVNTVSSGSAFGPSSFPAMPRPKLDTFIEPVGSWAESASLTVRMTAPPWTVTAVVSSMPLSMVMLISWSPAGSGGTALTTGLLSKGVAASCPFFSAGAASCTTGFGLRNFAASSSFCFRSQASTSANSFLALLLPSSGPRYSKSNVKGW